MARESVESRTRRAARIQDPFANGSWRLGVVDKIAASGLREIRVGDPICIENGWTEEHLRAMSTGTGGLGVLSMRSEFRDGEPTPLVPSGRVFVGYVWDVN